MSPEGRDPRSELLMLVARLLDSLGPFSPGMRREDKWLTTEQIAIQLERPTEIDSLDGILREHEARCLQRLEKGLPSEALLRRAKYPDRTTALPLWGSVKHHKEPWIGYRPDRSDPPDDIPSFLRVPHASPHVFLSHTHHDAGLALRLAEVLAAMQIGAWRFETHIDQRGDIADCVRKAIAETACLVALVTRHSIASLWILTELHTALKSGVPVVLVVDSDDALLLELLESLQFPNPNAMFDQSVEYDRNVIRLLNSNYALRETEARAARYGGQVHDFLATLPSYLSSLPPDSAERTWQSALAFPQLPASWSGIVQLGDLQELRNRVRAMPAETH
jgi:hypothetical protein